MIPTVVSVSLSPTHTFSKYACDRIELIADHGVQGDAHAGSTVKHRSRVAADPTQPNLRQVHLIHTELFDELKSAGFHVEPAMLGENITTSGINLLALAKGTRLTIGTAVIEVTGLRNPCTQLDDLQPGLLAQLAYRDEHGKLVRKSGIMGIVIEGGTVQSGDEIGVKEPVGPHVALERV